MNGSMVHRHTHPSVVHDIGDGEIRDREDNAEAIGGSQTKTCADEWKTSGARAGSHRDTADTVAEGNLKARLKLAKVLSFASGAGMVAWNKFSSLWLLSVGLSPTGPKYTTRFPLSLVLSLSVSRCLSPALSRSISQSLYLSIDCTRARSHFHARNLSLALLCSYWFNSPHHPCADTHTSLSLSR